MLHISCSGSPHEIGLKHGVEAKQLVLGSIRFYKTLFKKSTGRDWDSIQQIAQQFERPLRRNFPDYVEEMQGLATGAGTDLLDIIALNVRTEINFGLFNNGPDDGCTALSWKTETASYLAQNWDWNPAQKANLIFLTVCQPHKPTIKMVTEAGIIGKIGLNSAGVGVCLNAVKARGMDAERLPCHLGLRLVLESSSCAEAVAQVSKYGIGSSCNFLVADATGGIDLEWSHIDCKQLSMNAKGQIFHTNHWLVDHPGVVDTNYIKDSSFRVERIKELADDLGSSPSFEDVQGLLTDEKNYPAAICRAPDDLGATLFSFVADLGARRAEVIMGRPTDPDGRYTLAF